MHQFDRINIEISNSCNLKCSFCPSVERGKQVLTPAEFRKVLGDVAPLTKEVVLHLLGEPLGHPQLGEILEVAGQHSVPVNVVTNGVLMTGDRPKLLLSPIVRQVSFSLHSFEANFPDSDPGVYISRIKRFADQALIERPDLYLNLRFWDLDGLGASQPSRNHSVREATSRAFGFNWRDVTADLRRKKNWRVAGRLFLHFDSRFEWPSIHREILQERGTCRALKGHIGIHADGTVVPCCLDHNADIPLGNIFETSLEQILASSRATKMKQGFDRGLLVEDLCKRCGFIERFSRNIPKARLDSKRNSKIIATSTQNLSQ